MNSTTDESKHALAAKLKEIDFHSIYGEGKVDHTRTSRIIISSDDQFRATAELVFSSLPDYPGFPGYDPVYIPTGHFLLRRYYRDYPDMEENEQLYSLSDFNNIIDDIVLHDCKDYFQYPLVGAKYAKYIINGEQHRII